MASWRFRFDISKYVEYDCEAIKPNKVNENELKIVKILRKLNLRTNVDRNEFDILEVDNRIHQVLDLLQYLKHRPDYMCEFCSRPRHHLLRSKSLEYDPDAIDYSDNVQKILYKLLMIFAVRRDIPIKTFLRVMIESFGYAPMLTADDNLNSTIPYLFGEELFQEQIQFFLEQANSIRFELPIVTERLNEYLLRNMEFLISDSNTLTSNMVFDLLKYGTDEATAQNLFTKFAIDYIDHNMIGESRIPYDDDEYYNHLDEKEKKNYVNNLDEEEKDNEVNDDDEDYVDIDDEEDEEDDERAELAFLRDWDKSMKYILRSSKYVTLTDFEEAITDCDDIHISDNSKNSVDLLLYLRERDGLNFINSRLNLQVTRLDHLCRCKIRETLYRLWKLPEGIEKLGLSKKLTEYLELRKD